MKTALYLIVALLVIDKNGLGKDHVTTFSSVSPNAISRSIGGPNPAYSVGASNIFINPALLGKLPEKQFQISNVVHSGFLQYIIGALSIPVSGDDDIGLGVFWASLPDAQEFNQGGFLGGTSDNYHLGVMFGYSRAFYPFQIGINIRYLNFSIAAAEELSTANALGVDLGVLYAPGKSFEVGFVYQHTSDANWNTTRSSPAPRQAGLGLSWNPWLLANDFLRLIVGLHHLEGNPVQLNLGLDMALLAGKGRLKSFNIRSGYGNYALKFPEQATTFGNLTEWDRDFTVGAGLNFGFSGNWGLGLDYCFQIEEEFDNQHLITTTILF